MDDLQAHTEAQANQTCLAEGEEGINFGIFADEVVAGTSTMRRGHVADTINNDGAGLLRGLSEEEVQFLIDNTLPPPRQQQQQPRQQPRQQLLDFLEQEHQIQLQYQHHHHNNN